MKNGEAILQLRTIWGFEKVLGLSFYVVLHFQLNP